MSLPNESEYERQMSEAIAKFWPEQTTELRRLKTESYLAVRHCEVCREPETECLCRKRR